MSNTSMSILRRCVWVLIAALFSAMIAAEYVVMAIKHPNMCDFALISEVSRRVALGEHLYVDVTDQKGPLLYIWMAQMWRLCGSYESFFRMWCGVEALFRILSIFIVCRVCHEDGRDDACVLASFFLALFWVGMCHVEMYLMPALAWSVLVVRRDMRGETVPMWHYGVIGVAAGAMLLMKWLSCAMLMVVVAYGMCSSSWRRVGRGVCMAMACMVVSLAAFLFAIRGYVSLDDIMSGYILASDSGYLNMVLGRISFNGVRLVCWLCGAAYLLACVVAGSGLKHKVVWAMLCTAMAFLVFLMFSIQYYRVYAYPMIVVGILEGFSEHGERALAGKAPITGVQALVPAMSSLVALSLILCVFYAMSLDSYFDYLDECRRIIGDDDSVISDYVSSIDELMMLGYSSPYVLPAPNNTIGAFDDVERDINAGGWRYLLFNDNDRTGEFEVGDEFDLLYDIHGTVVAKHDGSYLVKYDVDDADVLHCDEYVVPGDGLCLFP